MNTLSFLRSSVLAALLLLVPACGDEFEPTEAAVPETGVTRSELLTDPNQLIFAVRKIDPYTFGINPIGNYSVLCPDGIYRTECTVSRLRLSDTGLSLTRQSQLLARIAAEPASESSASVLFKGVLVNVRDTRTTPTTSYFEFRATAAYWAPSVRTHASLFNYVLGAPSGGFQPATSVNTDLAPRGGGLNLTYPVQINWVGPTGERPANYPADSFVTVSAYRVLSGGQFALDVNQRFVRVSN